MEKTSRRPYEPASRCSTWHRITSRFRCSARSIAPCCATLVPIDTSVFLVGPTGVFKTELSALAMQHVGVGFDRLHLPAHWSATENFLERSAFNFKDAPLVIDDFAPGGAADRYRPSAREGGSHHARCRQPGQPRPHVGGRHATQPDFPPRGIIIGTGEDAPRGQSLRSRAMILDVAPGDVDRERLTYAQVLARDGVFAAGFAGFIQWLAPQMDELRGRYRRFWPTCAQAHTRMRRMRARRTPSRISPLGGGFSFASPRTWRR